MRAVLRIARLEQAFNRSKGSFVLTERLTRRREPGQGKKMSGARSACTQALLEGRSGIEKTADARLHVGLVRPREASPPARGVPLGGRRGGLRSVSTEG